MTYIWCHYCIQSPDAVRLHSFLFCKKKKKPIGPASIERPGESFGCSPRHYSTEATPQKITRSSINFVQFFNRSTG